MSRTPLVSVVVPTYNCRQYLPFALESVLHQTWRDLEVIVVDDGSTDDTETVVRHLDDGRIRYLRQQNGGVARARNTGITAATGQYVAYVDADDELDLHLVSVCLEEIEQAGADWCLTDIEVVTGYDDRAQTRLERCPVPTHDLVHAILLEDFVLRAPFYRRQVLLDVGLYDPRLRTREDWDMSIRLILAQRRFCHVRLPLYRYFMRADSLMHKSRKPILDSTLEVLQKHHRRLAQEGDTEAARIYARNLWWLGRDYLAHEKDLPMFVRCIAESMRYDFSPRRYANPLLSRLGAPFRDLEPVAPTVFVAEQAWTRSRAGAPEDRPLPA